MKEYEAEQQRLKRELQERQTQIDVLKNQIKLLTARERVPDSGVAYDCAVLRTTRSLFQYDCAVL